MRLRKLFCCCLTVLLCLILSAPAFAAEPIKVRTAWMDEHETFLIWYAKEKGWDKEVGLDIEILYFGSGMAILNALPAGEWVYAAMGAVPAMTPTSSAMQTRKPLSTACWSGRTAPSPR